MLTKENCTIQTMCQILESAYIDHSVKDNCIVVSMSGITTLLNAQGPFINLVTVFNAKPELSEQFLLKAINDVNSRYKFPNLSLYAGTTIVAQFAMLIGAGVPEKSLIEALHNMRNILAIVPQLHDITS